MDVKQEILNLRYQIEIINQGERFIKSEFGQLLIDKFNERKNGLLEELINVEPNEVAKIAKLQAEIKVSSMFAEYYFDLLGSVEELNMELDRLTIIDNGDLFV